MHLVMILIGLSLAWGLRNYGQRPAGTWSQRWQRALVLFLAPPLSLLMTAIAILWMGPHGRMVWWWEGWLSYGLAIALLGLAVLICLKLGWDGFCTLRRMRQLPIVSVQGQPARLLDTDELYSARVGFWRSELILSQGLLNQLDGEHLQAVLAHEQAHADHHDTFWFFWLGWVRRLTAWLPQTEDLWQELLALRELRADRQAVQTVDPLLLAEALFLVASAPLMVANLVAAFNHQNQADRLSERVEALLSDTEIETAATDSWPLAWLLWVMVPLVVVPFHF
jgi:Zn-dependent protease with chaperone function